MPRALVTVKAGRWSVHTKDLPAPGNGHGVPCTLAVPAGGLPAWPLERAYAQGSPLWREKTCQPQRVRVYFRFQFTGLGPAGAARQRQEVCI